MNNVSFTVPFAATWKRVKHGRQGQAYNPSAKDEKTIGEYALVARSQAGHQVAIGGDLHFYLTCYGLRGDVDNALKLAMDALTGVIYFDDAQVVFASVRKIREAENPRMEIEISEAP